MRTTTTFQGRSVEYDEISAEEAQELQAEGATLVDVRNDDERAERHVAASIHIPLPELADRIGDIPEGRVLLVCAKGLRSAAAAQIIEVATGRRDISSVAGGTDGWAAEGRPLG